MTNRRRSQSRPSASPRRCTHLLSFAQHPHQSMCRRSLKSCSQRRSTLNASFLRSRGSASPYYSTSTYEYLVADRLADPLRALLPHGQYDSTIHAHPMIVRTWTRHYRVHGLHGPVWGSCPSCRLILPNPALLYIFPLVRPCIICRRSDPLLLLHITLCLIDPSLYSSHTSQPRFYPYFRPTFAPPFSLFYNLGGPTLRPPTLVKVVLTANSHMCCLDSHLTMS